MFLPYLYGLIGTLCLVLGPACDVIYYTKILNLSLQGRIVFALF